MYLTIHYKIDRSVNIDKDNGNVNMFISSAVFFFDFIKQQIFGLRSFFFECLLYSDSKTKTTIFKEMKLMMSLEIMIYLVKKQLTIKFIISF